MIAPKDPRDPRVGQKRPFSGESKKKGDLKRAKVSQESIKQEHKLEVDLQKIFRLPKQKLEKAVGLVSRIIENIKHNPCSMKFRSLRYDNLKKREETLPGILVFLEQAGFQIQKLEDVRFVLENDQLDRFNLTSARFDRLLGHHGKRNRAPDDRMHRITSWLKQEKYQLSEKCKEALDKLNNWNGGNNIERMELYAEISSAIPMEFALNDQAAEFLIGELMKHLTKGNILDVGCGVGDCGRQLKWTKNTKDFIVDGIDISPNAISHARKQCVYDQLYVGDINAGPTGLRKDYYDAVISSNCFLYPFVQSDDIYPNPTSVLTCFSVLKPGGHFIVCSRQQPGNELNLLRLLAKFDAVCGAQGIEKVSEYVAETTKASYKVLAWKKLH